MAINTNSNVADINKCNAGDLNEIKNVVNTNASALGDITTLTTSDKTSVVNAINEVNNKNAMTIKLTSNYTIGNTNTMETVTGWAIAEQIGTGFSLSNDKIVVGNGISKVKINYTCKCNSSANTTRTFTYLTHNNTSISQEGAFFSATNQEELLSYTPRIISVSPGDTFGLSIYGYKNNGIYYGSSTVMCTYMTIEAIE